MHDPHLCIHSSPGADIHSVHPADAETPGIAAFERDQHVHFQGAGLEIGVGGFARDSRLHPGDSLLLAGEGKVHERLPRGGHRASLPPLFTPKPEVLSLSPPSDVGLKHGEASCLLKALQPVIGHQAPVPGICLPRGRRGPR